MKIELFNLKEYWRYGIGELYYSQEEYDYIYKYLDFDKLYKENFIHFKDEETGEWFFKTYINDIDLEIIYNQSPKGYEWLKENWGNDVFKIVIYYSNKQELKTIVNKIINVRLMRK